MNLQQSALSVLAAIGLLIAPAGCEFAIEDGADVGDLMIDISNADCKALGDPFPGCSSNKNLSASDCKGPWSSNWSGKKPICLGFGSSSSQCSIDDCKNCDKLDIKGWTLCKNKLFLDCIKQGKIPGGEDACFVTANGSVKAPSSWPSSGQVTAREMCYLGVPSNTSVNRCRKSAKCDCES